MLFCFAVLCSVCVSGMQFFGVKEFLHRDGSKSVSIHDGLLRSRGYVLLHLRITNTLLETRRNKQSQEQIAP